MYFDQSTICRRYGSLTALLTSAVIIPSACWAAEPLVEQLQQRKSGLQARQHNVLLSNSGDICPSGFVASTDRTSYTGTITRFATLSDALANVSPIDGPHTIPNRATAPPYDTPFRDLGVYIVNNASAYDVDANIVLTAWYYTTADNTNGFPKDDPDGNRYYSGFGNPNNTNTGFLQMYDDDGDKDTAISGEFANFDGTFWTEFVLSLTVEDAPYSDEFSRLWNAPAIGGPGSDTRGTFHTFEMNVVYSGLQGQIAAPGMIESSVDPTAVSGTLIAVFENTSGVPAYDGFYRTEFMFGLDSWVFDIPNADLNGDYFPSFFATVDDVPPTAICQDITVFLDETGNVSVTAAEIDDGSNDNCGDVTLAISQSEFDCGDLGDNTITLTVTDAHGNESTCTPTVTVVDNIAPTFSSFPDDITVQCAEDANPGIAYATVAGGIGIYYNDNGDGEIPSNQSYLKAQYSALNPNGAPLVFRNDNLVGTGFFSWQVLYSGLPHPMSQFAIDMVLPVPTGDGSNPPPVLNAYDHVSWPMGTGPAGRTLVGPVVWAINDYKPGGAGGVYDGTGDIFNSIVRPDTPPDGSEVTIFRNDVTQSGSIFSAHIAGKLTSNGIHHWFNPGTPHSSMSNFGLNGMFFFEGNLTYDAATDTDPLMDFYSGSIDITANWPSAEVGIPLAVDNCTLFPVVTYSDTDNGGSGCPGSPLIITRTWTATDESGNQVSMDQTITVLDDEPPTITCPADLSVTCLTDVPPPNTDDVQAFDNCDLSPVVVHVDDVTDGLTPKTIIRTYQATDACGNSATCTQTIAVSDTTPPVANCRDIAVFLDATGSVTIAPADVDDGSTDNCGIASRGVSPATFGCNDLGENTVTLTITDHDGNIATCESTVTVESVIAPDITCQDITIQLDDSGSASISAGDVLGSVMDACGVDTMTVEPNSFGCADVGDNEVTVTVVDVKGNVSTCMATVTVEDNVAPEAVCQDFVVALDANGMASIMATDVDGGSNDACGVANLDVSPNTFDCDDLGDNEVTLTVTDVNGNSSACTATVTVEDKEAPVALCRNATLQLNADGEATLNPAAVNNGSSDNCGISLSVAPNFFTCDDVGPNLVMLTVTDAAGNSDSCTATVNVQDNVPPVALCMDITIELDETGHASIGVADINDGSKDACGLSSLSLSQTTFNCCDVGPNNVTLFVRDVNNNLSVCTGVVTVINPFPPISICDLGDMNCDGCLTVSDIGPFVLAITDPVAYAMQFPNCNILHGDTNLDGFVTVGDIGRFVELLVGT